MLTRLLDGIDAQKEPGLYSYVVDLLGKVGAKSDDGYKRLFAIVADKALPRGLRISAALSLGRGENAAAPTTQLVPQKPATP